MSFVLTHIHWWSTFFTQCLNYTCTVNRAHREVNWRQRHQTERYYTDCEKPNGGYMYLTCTYWHKHSSIKTCERIKELAKRHGMADCRLTHFSTIVSLVQVWRSSSMDIAAAVPLHTYLSLKHALETSYIHSYWFLDACALFVTHQLKNTKSKWRTF